MCTRQTANRHYRHRRGQCKATGSKRATKHKNNQTQPTADPIVPEQTKVTTSDRNVRRKQSATATASNSPHTYTQTHAAHDHKRTTSERLRLGRPANGERKREQLEATMTSKKKKPNRK